MVLCNRCGKLLKNKNSIRIGYGPVCARKLGIIRTRFRRRKKLKSHSLIDFDKEEVEKD